VFGLNEAFGGSRKSSQKLQLAAATESGIVAGDFNSDGNHLRSKIRNTEVPNSSCISKSVGMNGELRRHS
jgi:hypothetical protein